MWKKVSCLIVLLLALFGFQQGVDAQSKYHYSQELNYYNGNTMELRNGSNGSMFNCNFVPGNVGFNNGLMSLKIDSDGRGGYTGGEWRSKERFGYGLYQVNMKPIKNPGVVSSFFTYTGPSEGKPWDEIDIEFLGKDTTKVQFNYFTNGRGQKDEHVHLHNLGFDASQGFHTYGFDWQADHITWYVDGRAVYTAYNDIPSTPGKIMMNAWPGKGVDAWLAPYNGQTPLYAYYDWISYDQF